MLRFINLRSQVYLDPNEYLFAFFDTIDDRFINIDDVYCWETVKDFITDYNNSNDAIPYLLDRYLALIPDDWKQE